jgi:hypothetical protein
MKYDFDTCAKLIRTPMHGRRMYRTRICFRDSRWPQSLTFTLWHTQALDALYEYIGGSLEWREYHLYGWDVHLHRYPPTREPQLHYARGGTDVLRVHLRPLTMDGPLEFAIYHGLGTRDLLWEYTEGSWKDERSESGQPTKGYEGEEKERN